MPYLEIKRTSGRRRGVYVGNYRLARGVLRVIAVIGDVVDCDVIQDHANNIGPYA
jgi:hypothetical protein